EYYYLNYCDSCTPEADFAEQFRALTGKSLDEYRFLAYNAAHTAGEKALEEAAARYGLDAGAPLLPLCIVDGRVYAGTEAIQTELPAYTVSQMEGTDSVLYYLYLPACESCAQVAPLLEALPDRIHVTLGDYEFESALRLRRVDMSGETTLALALLDAFSVPEGKRLAPLALCGERYYQGADAIRILLKYRIYQGAALSTPEVSPVRALPPLTVGSTLAAGLIAGLNPCALSMLLLFLSMIAVGGKRAGVWAALFLGAKLVAYLLIGTVFLGLLRLWNPVWLPTASKVTLTVVSATLILLNLRDGLMARREAYGKVRNQLPSGLRARLQARIRRIASGTHALSAVALGLLVASGEFLCAGQLYLATLLAQLHQGGTTLAGVALMLGFCLAFLLPSVLVAIGVLKGKAAFEVSEFFRRHLPLAKLLTALAFAAVLAVVWLT
ncbi:MAG TPA: hypothetical protein PKE04_18725, partial [Clostridia bacterium]|nr:hypothetical protein [Clostridia bacterium]